MPGRKTPGGADRFIPSRTGTDFEASRFHLLHHDITDAEKETMSPSKREYKRLMAENLSGGDLEKTRIISYQQIYLISRFVSSFTISVSVPTYFSDLYVNWKVDDDFHEI